MIDLGCPACYHNNRVYRYSDYIDTDANRALNALRADCNYDGLAAYDRICRDYRAACRHDPGNGYYIGISTIFRFFRDVDNNRMYLCDREHLM